MTSHPIPASDLFAPAELQRVFGALERKLAATPPAPPPEDPAAVRRRWLADRAEALIAGRFGLVHVDRCRDDDPGSTPALDAARRFLVQREKPILVLLGGVGCGKTTAATWIAREVGGARPGKTSATGMERRGRYDDGFAAWIGERTMVVLDDLGVEPLDSKGYFAALVDELVDQAWENRRRLVVTSNVAASDLRERLGARTASRLFEGAAIERCGDRDLRRTR